MGVIGMETVVHDDTDTASLQPTYYDRWLARKLLLQQSGAEGMDFPRASFSPSGAWLSPSSEHSPGGDDAEDAPKEEQEDEKAESAVQDGMEGDEEIILLPVDVDEEDDERGNTEDDGKPGGKKTPQDEERKRIPIPSFRRSDFDLDSLHRTQWRLLLLHSHDQRVHTLLLEKRFNHSEPPQALVDFLRTQHHLREQQREEQERLRRHELEQQEQLRFSRVGGGGGGGGMGHSRQSSTASGVDGMLEMGDDLDFPFLDGELPDDDFMLSSSSRPSEEGNAGNTSPEEMEKKEASIPHPQVPLTPSKNRSSTLLGGSSSGQETVSGSPAPGAGSGGGGGSSQNLLEGEMNTLRMIPQLPAEAAEAAEDEPQEQSVEEEGQEEEKTIESEGFLSSSFLSPSAGKVSQPLLSPRGFPFSNALSHSSQLSTTDALLALEAAGPRAHTVRTGVSTWSVLPSSLFAHWMIGVFVSFFFGCFFSAERCID